MTLTLTQSATAVAANCPASFLGVESLATPFSYAVLAGGAGGVINPSTGAYTAPSTISSDPNKLYDTIKVTDTNLDTATARILAGTPLLLFCEVIQRELGLADGRVYLWDQKIMQPTDSDLYVAVSVLRCKPFANVNRQSVIAGVPVSEQSVNVMASLDIDVISRGPSARDRKEEVIMALNSNYAESQQEANSFRIGGLPPSGQFTNLSSIDGAAIPYRYHIGVNMQYAVTKTQAVPYYDTFADPSLHTNS